MSTSLETPQQDHAAGEIAGKAQQSSVQEPAGDEAIDHTKRPKIISVTFEKKEAKTKLGLILRQDDVGPEDAESADDGGEPENRGKGDIYVAEVKPTGLLHESPLRVGDKILLVNRKACTALDKNEVIDMLRNLVGTVTIVAHNIHGNARLVESMVEKSESNPDAPIGVTMKKTGNGKLLLSDINHKGAFGDSLVAAGDHIVSINNVPCPYADPLKARDLIRQSTRFISITAEKSQPGGK